MPTIPDGVYSITKPKDNAATIVLFSAPPPPPNQILLLPETYGPEPKWNVKNLSNGNVTIQNVASEKYLGYVGKPEVGKICEQTDAIEWRIQQTKEKGKYHVVVPGGGPGGGTELVFDVSPLMVFPPLTDLAKLRLGETTQAWGFVLRNDREAMT